MTEVRRLWPEVLEEVKGKRRFTWILLSQNAHVSEVRNGTLVLTMPNVGARDSFAKGGSEDVLREALVVVLGADLRIEAIVDPGLAGIQSAPARGTAPQRAAASWDAPPTSPADDDAADDDAAAATAAHDASRIAVPTNTPVAAAAAQATGRPATSQAPPSSAALSGPEAPSSAGRDPALREQARQRIRPTRRAAGRSDQEEVDERDSAADRDDTDVEDDGESHTALLARHLGAEIIAEEEHGA